MVFYVTLFLICFMIASVVVWLYRALEQASNRRYRGILPSRHSTATKRSRSRRSNEVKTPWGWKTAPDLTQRRSVATAASAQQRSSVGWPYRSEPFEASSRRTLKDAGPGSKLVGNRGISKGGIEKPWGW